MAWTNISNANLDVGAPIRSIDILALRDNITAQANGDAGAPKQQTAGIADLAITAAKMSGNQPGTAPAFAGRAWVNFNGTGTVAIRSSGNVSSITDNGTGDYTVNFAVAMEDRNYAMLGTADRAGTNEGSKVHIYEFGGTVPTTTACRIRCGLVSYSEEDALNVSVTFFR
jgi:hypothetical protein